MSYASAVAILILVLSPVLIPLTITAVHTVADWRRNKRSALEHTGPNLKNTDPKSRAVTSN
jgi:hypothetical protein